jgi:hypothetical protein
MKTLRSKLTYANVMVTILAFAVLAGGTAYAATQLPKNSVGAKQLKKGAVKPGKLSRSAKAALAGATGPVGPRGPEGARGPQGSSAQPLAIDATATSVPVDESTHAIALTGTTSWTAPPGEVGYLAVQAIMKLATNTTAPAPYESCTPSLRVYDNGVYVGENSVVFGNSGPEAATFNTFRPENIEATIGVAEPGIAHTITVEYEGQQAWGCKPGSEIETLGIVVIPQG